MKLQARAFALLPRRAEIADLLDHPRAEEAKTAGF
jgi:hypothetical protein